MSDRFCNCLNGNHQSDAIVLLPDNSRYCMLCGLKKRPSVISVDDNNSDENTKEMTHDNENDDDDDVIIVKEEKRPGVAKVISSKSDIVNTTSKGSILKETLKKATSQHSNSKKTKSIISTKFLPKVTKTQVTRINDQTPTVLKVKFPLNPKPKNPKIKVVYPDDVRKSQSKINSDPGLVLLSKPGIGTVKMKFPTKQKPSHKEVVNEQTDLTKSSPHLVIPFKSANNDKDHNKPKTSASNDEPKKASKTDNSLKRKIDNKNPCNDSSQAENTSNKQPNTVRKSKRTKKATTRFNDCITMNLDIVSDSSSSDGSDDSDSDDSSSDDSDSDASSGGRLNMLDDDNICHVCMSYEPPIEFEQGCDLDSFELKWIDCDGCHQWFHWFCVGIFDPSDTKFFKCKTCRSRQV